MKGPMAKLSRKELLADIKTVAGESTSITRDHYLRTSQLGKAYESVFGTFEEFRKAAKLASPDNDPAQEKAWREKAIEVLKSRPKSTQFDLFLALGNCPRGRAADLWREITPQIYSGNVYGVREKKAALPEEGKISRYILSSAQNNTPVNVKLWQNLQALARHYDAQIMIGTYSYNQNQYGKLSVKRGTAASIERELWFDPEIEPYISDERVELADGLVWCGEMNMMPTAVRPLDGLETYSGRKSAIFPHTKIAMRSIFTMQGEGTKLNFTTGTVTLRNYIQKKEGLKAEFHHQYAALLVEVNHTGNWWVRQLASASDGSIQDLTVLAKDGKIQTGQRVEAITFGDLHSGCVDPVVLDLSMKMLDELKPKHIFLHDVLEGASLNPHERNSPHRKFHTWLRGLHRVDEEIKRSKDVMLRYVRPGMSIIVPNSNHDDPWLYRWLKEHDYRVDPPNAELFLRLQAFMYASIRDGKMVRDVNILAEAFRLAGLPDGKINFLLADESFKICNGRIECGQHGHLGPGGRFGTPESLAKVARRANTAHTHAAGIYDGLYVAGTSSVLRWDYNRGPSNWSWSHTLTYPNGQRAIVTMYAGDYKAQ
jgi:hypothetical protein